MRTNTVAHGHQTKEVEMSLPPAPESTKKNQHFVPRFWQERFAGSNGRIFARYRIGSDPTGRRAEGARQANVGSTMSQDWTYTVFDRWWRPSDVLENELSKLEGRLSFMVSALDPLGTIPDKNQTWELCRFVGLAACRTPETMARFHNRVKELALALSDVGGAESFEHFRDEMWTRFGMVLTEDEYGVLRQRPTSTLANTAQAINKMSPQNPVLPAQLALIGIDTVAGQVNQMTLELLDAPATHHFILRDTPLPNWDLAQGFIVPLSSSLALRAIPRTNALELPTRRTATADEVTDINVGQYAQARDVVIGPDATYLNGLA
jgi:hypothetical protein